MIFNKIALDNMNKYYNKITMYNKVLKKNNINTKDNKFIKYEGIKIELPIQNNNYVGGKLWQYINHTMESEIFLKIIKYIRKNKDRITIIGIDNDKIDRDYDMYKIIMKHYNKNNINFYEYLLEKTDLST